MIELLHIGLNTGEYHVLGQVMLENHILNFTAEFSISNQQQHSIWKVSNDLFKHLNQKAVIFLLCKSSNMAYYKCIFVNSIFFADIFSI